MEPFFTRQTNPCLFETGLFLRDTLSRDLELGVVVSLEYVQLVDTNKLTEVSVSGVVLFPQTTVLSNVFGDWPDWRPRPLMRPEVSHF